MKFPDAIEETLEHDILKMRSESAPKFRRCLRPTSRWTRNIWSFCAAGDFGRETEGVSDFARLRERRGF